MPGRWRLRPEVSASYVPPVMAKSRGPLPAPCRDLIRGRFLRRARRSPLLTRTIRAVAEARLTAGSGSSRTLRREWHRLLGFLVHDARYVAATARTPVSESVTRRTSGITSFDARGRGAKLADRAQGPRRTIASSFDAPPEERKCPRPHEAQGDGCIRGEIALGERRRDVRNGRLRCHGEDCARAQRGTPVVPFGFRIPEGRLDPGDGPHPKPFDCCRPFCRVTRILAVEVRQP